LLTHRTWDLFILEKVKHLASANERRKVHFTGKSGGRQRFFHMLVDRLAGCMRLGIGRAAT
jgi:hypothetical protein